MENGECNSKDNGESTSMIGFGGDEGPPDYVVELLAFIDQFGQTWQR
jgi:hypothetical protein